MLINEAIIENWEMRFKQKAHFRISENDKKEVRRIKETYNLTDVVLNRNCDSCYRDAISIIIYYMKKSKKAAETPEVEKAAETPEVWKINTKIISCGNIRLFLNGKYYNIANTAPKGFLPLEEAQDIINEALIEYPDFSKYFTKE